ncbi:MAG: hypothetical protein K6U03_02125 [Firmicutes bacterium]|nr:hypothetical protein [Bacillota bacterium]
MPGARLRVLGLSRSAVAQIEAGNRKVDSIELSRIARFLGRAVGDFLAPEFQEDGVAVVLRALAEARQDPRVQEELSRALAIARRLNAGVEERSPDDGGALRSAERRLLHLALEALEREEISRRKFIELAELAGLNEEEIDDIPLARRSYDMKCHEEERIRNIVLDASSAIDLIEIGLLEAVLALPSYRFGLPRESLEEIKRPSQRACVEKPLLSPSNVYITIDLDIYIRR